MHGYIHPKRVQYIDGLRNGKWADNLAVQSVADINIEIINTITPEWAPDIHSDTREVSTQ